MADIVSNDIQAIVGLLLAVSIASERLVEIVKGLIPWLNQANANPVQEGCRKSALQMLAVVSGIVTAYLSSPVLAESLSGISDRRIVIVSIGLLASGGSAFWNAILSYLLQVKDLKKQEVIKASNKLPDPVKSGAIADLDLAGEQVTSNECYDVEDK